MTESSEDPKLLGILLHSQPENPRLLMCIAATAASFNKILHAEPMSVYSLNATVLSAASCLAKIKALD